MLGCAARIGVGRVDDAIQARLGRERFAAAPPGNEASFVTVMALSHSIRAAVLVAATASVAGSQTPPSPTGTSNFSVFLRGVQIGTEELAVVRSADGWTVSSNGRIGAPIELVTRNLQIRYDPDWKARELTLDADRPRPGVRPPHQHHRNDRDDPCQQRRSGLRPDRHRRRRRRPASQSILRRLCRSRRATEHCRSRNHHPGLPGRADTPLHPGWKVRVREDSNRRPADRRAPHARDALSDGTAGGRGRHLGRRGRSAAACQCPGTVDRVRPRRRRLGLDAACRHLPGRRRTGAGSRQRLQPDRHDRQAGGRGRQTAAGRGAGRWIGPDRS